MVSLLLVLGVHAAPYSIPPEFDPVVDELMALYTSLPQYAASAIRLAFHSSFSFDVKTGQYGSNGGAMYYASVSNRTENLGLGKVATKLEIVFDKFDGLTRADLYVLSGVVGVSFLGGPKVNFCGGREDFDESKIPPEGLMPLAAVPQDDVPAFRLEHIHRSISESFARVGFDQREMTALIGAHAVGVMQIKNSGYAGPWIGTGKGNFTNRYFTNLLSIDFLVYTNTAGNFQYAYKTNATANPDGSTPLPNVMIFNMLPADMCLKTSYSTLQYVHKYALDNQAFYDDFTAAYYKLTTAGVRCKTVHITPKVLT